jgi:endonuclease YncB( thermonuclease family)
LRFELLSFSLALEGETLSRDKAASVIHLDRRRWLRYRNLASALRRQARSHAAPLYGFAIVIVLLAAAGATYLLVQDRISVIDGDTVRYQGRTVRLVGFDTPERATSRLRLIKVGPPNLTFVPCACPPGTEGMPSGNYGRFCSILTSDGRDVGPILIAEGLAKPFRCSGFSCPRRVPWC